MIQEKMKQAFSGLFPPAERAIPAASAPDEAEETGGKKAPPKEPPRTDGVIERDYAVHGYHLDVQVSPSQLKDAVTLLDQAEFFLESITGVDWLKEGQMEVVYDFSRYDFDLCRVVIRTRVSRTDPVVPTITDIYAGANWHERETHDFFGITFAGHPHLIPLLLPEDADFHPLRKDFTV